VGLIDEEMARRAFGPENPVGKRFRRALPGFTEPWSEIVGVVGHVHNDSLEKDPRAQVYWPETQHTQDRAALVVKTGGRPELFTQSVLDRIHSVDPDQPVYDIRTMGDWVTRTEGTRALLTGIVAVFGGASLLLASLGLYGVVSYTADLRVREFGIRMALGANAGQVARLVLRHAGKLALCGSALGLAMAWPAGRALQSLLFGVSGGDAVSLLLAPAVLILVALVAGFVPARRAAKADPAVTLRAE
jgi:putative ABC transport system permease protein